MSLFVWIAAAWLVAAAGLTAAFFAAKRFNFVHTWLFGKQPSAEVRNLAAPVDTSAEQPTRLAA